MRAQLGCVRDDCVVLGLEQLEQGALCLSRTGRQHGSAGGADAWALGAATVDRERHRAQSPAQWEAKAQAAESTLYRREISSSVGRSTSSTERSTDRSARAASIAASARSRS